MLNYLSGAEIGKKKKEKKKKGKGKVAQIALAPARAAFLGAVSLNVLKLATKLKKAWLQDKEKVKKFWKDFGGKEDALLKAINKGSKSNLSGNADVGIALQTAMATALPIILKVVKMLKGMGIQKPEDDAETNKFTDEQKEKLDKDTEVPKGKADMQGEEVAKTKGGEERTQGNLLGGRFLEINTWVKSILIFGLMANIFVSPVLKTTCNIITSISLILLIFTIAYNLINKIKTT